jgi:hypothetical protein
LNGCNEKFKLKTDPQVLENKLCRWIMKHRKPTKFDENWCGFEKLRRIINENTVTNTKRKSEQEHCLILFVENKHENFDFGCFVFVRIHKPTATR